MFCKNARTILAMATDTETKRPEAPLAVKPAPVAAAPEPQQQQQPVPPVTPALLAALTKTVPPPMNKNAALLRNEATTNLQLLELHLKQQEQANRILLEHAMALSLQQRQEQQASLAVEQARLLQMRQLMNLRTRQKQDASPSNPRASAA